MNETPKWTGLLIAGGVQISWAVDFEEAGLRLEREKHWRSRRACLGLKP